MGFPHAVHAERQQLHAVQYHSTKSAQGNVFYGTLVIHGFVGNCSEYKWVITIAQHE